MGNSNSSDTLFLLSCATTQLGTWQQHMTSLLNVQRCCCTSVQLCKGSMQWHEKGGPLSKWSQVSNLLGKVWLLPIGYIKQSQAPHFRHLPDPTSEALTQWGEWEALPLTLLQMGIPGSRRRISTSKRVGYNTTGLFYILFAKCCCLLGSCFVRSPTSSFTFAISIALTYFTTF